MLLSGTVIPKEIDLNLSSVTSKGECVDNQSYSPVPNNRGVLVKGGGATDNLNINKRGWSPNKRGGSGGWGSENCSRSEVATRYHYLWGLLWLNPEAHGQHLQHLLQIHSTTFSIMIVAC